MKKYCSTLLALWLLSCGTTTTETTQSTTHTIEKVGQSAEYNPARTIVMHAPGREISLGMLHPQAALFEVYFNIDKAAEEHAAYARQLTKSGANVVMLRDLLAAGCSDGCESEELTALREFALSILQYNCEALSDEAQSREQEYKRSVIESLSVDELLDVIIMQPTITLFETEHNTGLAAQYEYNPLMNLFYMRDQTITTPKGVVICRMNSTQRQQECDVVKFGLRKLGIEPLYEVQGEGAYLEGGDYITAFGRSFIGCGMRTTQRAIDSLLHRDLFGTDSVVVVKDRRFYQAEMHLDTYFNVIDKDLATISAERMCSDPSSQNYVCVDIYLRGDDEGYSKVAQDIPFTKLLQSELGVELIPIKEEDQARMANNFLTVAPRKIMAVKGQSAAFMQQLSDKGVEVEWIELSNLTKGYGAAHCMTQVIERE